MDLSKRGSLSAKHRATLADLFAKPTRPDIAWSRTQALVLALGGAVEQRAGSRVVLKLNGVRAVVHSPHPSPEMTRPSVRSVADFLTAAGIGGATAGVRPQNR